MSFGLKVLADAWQGCTRCGLGEERPRHEIVFGAGRRSAKYLLVYDTPTANDVEQAGPMSGKEGDELVNLLEEAGIALRDVYCTPIVGCRPLTFVPETELLEAHVLDRAPNKKEVTACYPRVQEIIYRVDPLVIFTLGVVAWKVLVKPHDRGRFTSLDKAVGELFTTRISGRWLPEVPYDVISLLSIQQILSQPSYAAHGPRATTARYLHKGRHYAEYVEQTGKRDRRAAGFDDQESSAEGAGGSGESVRST